MCSYVTMKVGSELVHPTKPGNSMEMRAKGGIRGKPAPYKILDAIFPHFPLVFLLLGGAMYISSYYQV